VAEEVVVVGSASGKEKTCLNKLSLLFSNKTSNCPSMRNRPMSFNCVYQPKFVKQSMNFLVFENFYYVSSGIGGEKSIKTCVLWKHRNPLNLMQLLTYESSLVMPVKGPQVTSFPLLTSIQQFENAAVAGTVITMTRRSIVLMSSVE
jgi:hypothetical protein